MAFLVNVLHVINLLMKYPFEATWSREHSLKRLITRMVGDLSTDFAQATYLGMKKQLQMANNPEKYGKQ